MTGYPWSSWQRIEMYLGPLSNKASYARYVEGLLQLIPQLRTVPEIGELQPGLSHLTLTLNVPGSRRRLHIDLDRPGYYNVYLDQCTDSVYGAGAHYGDQVIVPLEEVIPTVRRYMAYLQAEGLTSV